MKKYLKSLILLSLIIVVATSIFIFTPVLHLNEEDTAYKYQNFYVTLYKITKSEKILNHTISFYSSAGNNYEKLAPLFEDAFVIKNKYNQDTIEINAFTFTEGYYVDFLISNNKLEEASDYISTNLNKTSIYKIEPILNSIALFNQNKVLVDFAIKEMQIIIESNSYQKVISNKINGSISNGAYLSAWPDYVYALYFNGQSQKATEEIFKMAQNKENGLEFIKITLFLIYDNGDGNGYINQTLSNLEKSKLLSSKQIKEIREYIKLY